MLLTFIYLTVLAGGSSSVTQGHSRRRGPVRARVRLDVANATGDRMQLYIEGELARRMAVSRRLGEPDLGRRTLNMSELYLEDEELYDSIPDFNESMAQYTRRLTDVSVRYQMWYHTNYQYAHPPDDDAIKKMHSLMRQKMYESRESIDDLKPMFDEYKDSLKLRFAFVFRRLDNLLDEISAIYSHMMHQTDHYQVSRHLFYHQHLLRRHVDVIYITERTVHMYNWYKERERRLNSVLAARLTTPAEAATLSR